MASDKVFATLVFVRHGQSEWNASNQFTGWVDVGLTDLGKEEALDGAQELKKAGYQFDILFTSYLKRAIKTANIVLEEIDQSYIPVKRTWRLNERMYGGLQGLNKTETKEKHGEKLVLDWRRSFDIPPPEIDEKSEYNPANEAKYKRFCDAKDIPKTECLKDVIARVDPYWKSDVEPELKAGKTILMAAHGNSIRAICKYLDKIDEATIPSLEIPTGCPLVYQFDKDLNIIKNDKAVAPLSGVFLGDPAAIKAKQKKVAEQINQKKDDKKDDKKEDDSQNRFKLPSLPYAEDALEKGGISKETIQYHYGKHHAGYVRKLNAQDKDGNVKKDASLEDLIKDQESSNKIFNLAAQIWNHTFYWESMAPNGGTCKADSEVGKQIIKDFESVDKFIAAFKARAGGHFGAGWVWLSINPEKNLVITEGHDAFNPLKDGMTPILTIDVWEHAYYIDQRNNRGAYIEKFIGLINWDKVNERFVNGCK